MPDDDGLDEQQTGDDVVAALRAELAAANQRAEAEARRADGLYSQVADGSRRLAASEVTGLAAQEAQAETAITGIASELKDLQAQFANLQAEGKFEEAAEINTRIADAAARRQQALQAKTYYGRERESAARQPVDPVDRFLAANPNFSAPEQEWIKRNPRYATDAEFQRRVNAAHAEVVAKGVAAQTPEYFQGLEQAGYMRAPVARTPEPPRQRQAGDDDETPYSAAADEDNTRTVEEPAVNSRPAATRGQVAASPSRRSVATPQRDAESRTTRLTADEAETAIALSELFPEDVQNGGDAAIFAHYAQLKNGPLGRKRRAEWAAGG